MDLMWPRVFRRSNVGLVIHFAKSLHCIHMRLVLKKLIGPTVRDVLNMDPWCPGAQDKGVKVIWDMFWGLLGQFSSFECDMKVHGLQMCTGLTISLWGLLGPQKGPCPRFCWLLLGWFQDSKAQCAWILSGIQYISVNTGMCFTLIIYKGHMKAPELQVTWKLKTWFEICR